VKGFFSVFCPFPSLHTLIPSVWFSPFMPCSPFRCPVWMLQTLLKSCSFRAWPLPSVEAYRADMQIRVHTHDCDHAHTRMCTKARNHAYMCMCTKAQSCSHICIQITAISRHVYVNMNCKYALDHSTSAWPPEPAWCCMHERDNAELCVYTWVCSCTHECAHGRTFL